MAKTIGVEKRVEITSDVVHIVQLLGEDMTVHQVSEKLKINKRTLEAKIAAIKLECGTKTLYGLVALFFRNKLIK